MGFWIGAAITLPLTALCGIYSGIRIAKGDADAIKPAAWAWLVGFHGAGGVLGLWLVMQAVR